LEHLDDLLYLIAEEGGGFFPVTGIGLAADRASVNAMIDDIVDCKKNYSTVEYSNFPNYNSKIN
jgi:hypothetical protein